MFHMSKSAKLGIHRHIIDFQIKLMMNADVESLNLYKKSKKIKSD